MIKEFYTKLHKNISSSKLPAYLYYDNRYTYQDLYRYMEKLNYYLVNYKQKRIVVYGHKNIGVYAAIYSVILSGNVWAPFTPGYPVSRLLGMLSVLDAGVIIYDKELPQELINYAKENGILVWNLNELLVGEDKEEFGNFNFSEDDLAYIMFTSGSTGNPKGVPITHLNYINFINNAMEILPFKKGEVFSDYHDFAFDISIFYLFCAPLTESAISPIIKDEEKIFPVKHLQENRITIWASVPSVISRIQRLRPNGVIKNCFSILFLCGEPFSLNVLKYCYDNLGVKNVYNFYGLTETGVENFYHRCSPEDLKKYEDKGFVPIGRPLNGNNIKLTEVKELLLHGCQITPGYLRGIEASRFEIIDGKRYYHTGDILEKFGDVYFCKGRLDSQVKLSGYRIEMMDIEVQVKKQSGIKEAVCFVDDAEQVKLLICAYVPEKGASIDIQGLKAKLANSLPDYMVPKKFFMLDDMPRNNNDKLDRKKIKEMYFGKISEGAKV